MRTTGFKMYEGADSIFLTACTLAGVQPTRRQHARWRQGRGQAFAMRLKAAEVAKAS